MTQGFDRAVTDWFKPKIERKFWVKKKPPAWRENRRLPQ
tara:strand:- start:152 stop:268 length:117 start_codon:yes stop_codon:yes gene_type:complete